MDVILKTPKKVTLKQVKELHQICIVCVLDVTTGDGLKGRRYVTSFQNILEQADQDYCEVFRTIPAQKLFLCKACFGDLKKVADRIQKRQSLQSEVDAYLKDIILKSKSFKAQYLQWKRGRTALQSKTAFACNTQYIYCNFYSL